MTGKSYAAVSGAIALAAWLAAQAPSSAPTSVPPQVTRSETAGTSGPSEIEREAARLGARVQREVEFRRPERNPFRFNGSRRSTDTAPAAPVEPVTPSAGPDAAPAAPAPPPLVLSGIAENQVGERTERTAIFSSPAGVLLVREGETILGQYRVGRIDATTVELIRVEDGTTTRFLLR
jgi:hypothetical protein